MGTDMFYYGTLCHAPLLRTVLGRDVDMLDARLPGYAARWALGRPHPVLIESADDVTNGVLVRDLSATDVARLNYYEDGFAFTTRRVTIETFQRRVQAQVYMPLPGQWQAGEAWSLADWQASVGEMVTATAGDVMALFGQAPAAQVLGRYNAMLLRGAGRVRARKTAPTTLRRIAAPGDVDIARRTQPYADFFAVEDYALRFRRFDGTFSPLIERAAFISADAVTVLPYDPVRDRVLLIEQFRMGPFARGDTQPWMLEPIAGRIDPGETPQAAARREAVEEAGLALGPLLDVASYYPSPGVKSEFIYSFIALCDLPDGVAGVFGAEGEAEDIRGHLIPYERLLALVTSGEVATGPLLITALWLQRERTRLRKAAFGKGGTEAGIS